MTGGQRTSLRQGKPTDGPKRRPPQRKNKHQKDMKNPIKVKLLYKLDRKETQVPPTATFDDLKVPPAQRP